ncbi:MAG: hypothetical protein ACR2F9_07505, partial [Longimicrobiaceae bacterium]
GVWFLFAPFLVACCFGGVGGRGARPPPRTDTLAGYELGTLRSEVEQRATAAGDSLACEELPERVGLKRTKCGIDDGSVRLELLNNQLTSIRRDLPGGRSASAARDDITAKYGPPVSSREDPGEEWAYRVYWAGTDSTSRLELACPDTLRSDGCQTNAQRVTPTGLQQLRSP